MNKSEYEKSLLETYDLSSENIDISLNECLILELENISFSIRDSLDSKDYETLSHWTRRLEEYKAYILG